MAPPGAPHQWLPGDQWLQSHWIPFDQRDLERALGLHGRGLEAYLVNDHNTLAALARRRGVDVDVEQLADDLVARACSLLRSEPAGASAVRVAGQPAAVSRDA
jgi:hypothetical protein